MKFLFVILIAVFSLSNTKAQASEINVSAAVLHSFKTSFKDAAEVAWKQSGNFYKADFTMNGQYVSAYFDVNACLVAVTKNISSVQLPVTLQTGLKTAYSEHWISDLFELSDEHGTVYYVTVENGDAKITLKSSGNNWTVFQKQRKA